MEPETELEMVRRHVRQGAVHVANQCALIARLKTYGLPTGMAETILASFEELQRLHQAHLARAESGLDQRPA